MCIAYVHWVPYISEIETLSYFSQKWFDGGFTDNLPTPPQGKTISVSPFSGNSDICPQDSSRPLSAFYWRRMHVLVSRENARRSLNILYPPTNINVNMFFNAGFNDAMRYLNNVNKLSMNQ